MSHKLTTNFGGVDAEELFLGQSTHAFLGVTVPRIHISFNNLYIFIRYSPFVFV